MPISTSKYKNWDDFSEYFLPVIEKEKNKTKKLFRIKDAIPIFTRALNDEKHKQNGDLKKGFREIIFHLEELYKETEAVTSLDIKNETIQEIVLIDKDKIPKKQLLGEISLSNAQLVLFFKHLRKQNVILNYDNLPLAKLLSILTNKSENTLKDEFTDIEKRINDKNSKQVGKDIDKVIQLLNSLLADFIALSESRKKVK